MLDNNIPGSRGQKIVTRLYIGVMMEFLDQGQNHCLVNFIIKHCQIGLMKEFIGLEENTDL